MKRIFALLLATFTALSLGACSNKEVSGLKNFSAADCSVELSKYLFPGEDFLSRFAYESGAYEYADSGDIVWGYATAFAYLCYEMDVYEQAKEYCQNYFTPCSEHQYEYNGYQFVEHLCHGVRNEDESISVGCAYPRHFNLFGYNDQTHTLVFLGYYNGDPNDAERELAQDDFGTFLQNVYSSYFDFG